MEPEKVILDENHRRSLTSSLIIAEGLLIEIRDLFGKDYKTCCLEIKNDIDSALLPLNIQIVDEALDIICKLTKKYSTSESVLGLQRVADAKKTRIWEVLSEAKSRKMKGFGEFPKRLVRDYDKDIDELMKITERIRII